MIRKLDPSDFRARREILDPSDFALGGDTPDPQPTDLVTEEAWNGIMTLPSDVAVRTTSYQGSRVALLYELWTGWIDILPPSGMIAEAMLDSADDFAAALFNLVHGFYKQSVASLRSALETIVSACDCELSDDRGRWAAWQDGEEQRFSKTCDRLRALPKFTALEDGARQLTNASIFPVGDASESAWARNLYQRLSKFSHARGDSTNGNLWRSNGPVYSANGMQVGYCTYLETYALLILVMKIATNQLKMPAEARIIYRPDSLCQYMPPPFHDLCAYYSLILFPSI